MRTSEHGAALAALTGRPDGPPLPPPAGVVEGMERLVDEIVTWSSRVGETVRPDWEELVTVRARLAGLSRRGRMSANGSCRLLCGRDGWAAVNLPRPEDVAAVPAIVEGVDTGDPWAALEAALVHRPVADVVARARLLGVAAAPLGPPDDVAERAPPASRRRAWTEGAQRELAALRVVDLSSMWAGPLATHLLASCGARVTKVESASRPDSARAEAAFYRTLHAADQEVVSLDFASTDDRDRLRALLEEADIVVESSRPRALEQLGAGPDVVSGPPGKVWCSITGYGRSAPGRDWVAFGDDAAVAGGLVGWEGDGLPVFCGDALADPVTGLAAAAAVLEAVAGGGGVLLDVSMQRCAAALVVRGTTVAK